MRMTHRCQRIAVLAALCGLTSVAATSTTNPTGINAPPRPMAQASGDLLDETGEAYWQLVLDANPALASLFGQPVERIPYARPDAVAALADRAAELLARLDNVDPATLGHGEAIDLGTLRRQLLTLVADARFYWYGFEVTPYSSPLTSLPGIFTALPLAAAPDRRHYLDLLDQAADYVRGIEWRLQGQRQRGIRIAKPEIDAVVPFVRAAARAGESSPYWPAAERLEEVGRDAAAAFRSELAPRIEAINDNISRLADLVDSEAYRAEAPDQVGAWVLPGGEDWYRYLVRSSTTMDITPEEVHEIGLQEVERINGEMAAVRRQLGFEGTKAEFHHFLKTDSLFFPTTVEQVHETLLGYAAEMEPILDDLFLRRPEAPYGVKRLEPEREPALTFGVYEPPRPDDPVGYYRYNGSQLDQRSLLFFQALTYHELAPGHHFQISLQIEHESLPNHRRYGFFGAFTEGWGDYSAQLGIEAGLYDDPYDMYGRLSMDIFLSTRLVVDTGMNLLRWPRSRAVRFMRENLLESDTQIMSETLRYAVDIPGQALAYKMGARQLWELRRRAQEALGERFDVRRFHEAVIGSGAMPMDVLGRHIDWFIEQERGGS